MSFFNKLKSRLTRSSSKLGEGLDAIVEDGGVEEPEAAAPASEPDVTPVHQAAPAPAPEPEPAPAPAPQPEPEPAPLPGPEPVPAPEPERQPEPEPEELPEPEPELEPEAEPLPTPEEEPAPAPEQPEEAPDEVVPDAPELPEATPAEAPQPLDPMPDAVPDELGGDMPASIGAPDVTFQQKPGFFSRLLGRKDSPAEPRKILRRALDDAMLESLEELMIASDMGVDTALRVTANIAEGRLGKRLSADEIKGLMAGEIARIMEPVARPLPIYPKKPQVVLVVGVNGSGKTTTIGKLASQFKAAGKSVVIAAGDTFRAAAVEQLQVWGERAGVPVLTAPEGSDPASLAFDAMAKAEADGADLLMIDTAGRLQNRADLMEELSKIVRVIKKKDDSAPHNTLLVLDATTGQNALSQVETFQKMADVSGLIMTKLDGTAKGGVLVALADKFGLPIHAIGVGEQIDDLAPFDPEEFARALTGA